MYVYSNKPPKRGWQTFLTIIATALITIGAVKIIPYTIGVNANDEDKEKDSNVEKLSLEVSGDKAKQDEKSFVEIIQDNMPSVVGVSVLKPDGDGILDLELTEKWGIGTGVILSTKGYILTNQHLASRINGGVTITLDDGEEVRGRTIWSEANLDLAIVKIDEKLDLLPIKLGDSEICNIGEEVIAIGNPLGLEFQKSVTKGVISGLNRTLKVEDTTSTVVMENLIQTDASINTGNSGGPLINQNGEVIGINTVKITSAEGIGFAVPINIIKPILNKLESDEIFEEAYLGIFAYDSEIVPYLDKNIDTNHGIYVATVTQGTPAQKAGLQVGDIILSIDGFEINKMIELRAYLYEKEPGDKIELNVLRRNSENNISVTLGKR